MFLVADCLVGKWGSWILKSLGSASRVRRTRFVVWRHAYTDTLMQFLSICQATAFMPTSSSPRARPEKYMYFMVPAVYSLNIISAEYSLSSTVPMLNHT